MFNSILLLLAACNLSGDAPVEAPSGLQSRVAIALDTDVAGVDLTATEVDCATGIALPGGDVHQSSADLLGARLGDFDLSIDPLAAESDHDFTDIFILVNEGCYDLVAQPVDSSGNPSTDCSIAVSDGLVEVLDGLTTEVLLLSTCDGQATGGLDTIIAFNEEPTISDLTYDPSKFTDVCSAPVVVCVDATDPNLDPVEFTWDVGTASFTVVSHEQVIDISTECIEITPSEVGDIAIDVAAYDLFEDGSRIEDYFTDIGNPADSHDTLEAPLHVSGTDDDLDSFFACNDCDDTDPNINADAEEICDNDIDDNCDGETDEDCAQTVTFTVSADNAYHLWVDGQPITNGANVADWSQTDTYTMELGPGNHAIGLYLEDWGIVRWVTATIEVNGTLISATDDGSWTGRPEVLVSLSRPNNWPAAAPGDGAAGMQITPDADWNTVGFTDPNWSTLLACTNTFAANYGSAPSVQDLANIAGMVWPGADCLGNGNRATLIRTEFSL